MPNLHWEAVLVSCGHLVKILFYTHLSTENRIFEGSFLPHSLRLCPASFPPWFPKNLVSFLAWDKSLACRQLPPNQDINSSNSRNCCTSNSYTYVIEIDSIALPLKNSELKGNGLKLAVANILNTNAQSSNTTYHPPCRNCQLV